MAIKKTKFIFYSVLLPTLFIFCVACSQEGKAKRKFVSIIEKEFKSLKAEEIERKEEPKCQLINAYLANYREYTKYRYDIRKKDSIVTPFYGRVTYIFNSFEKRGSTMQECIDSEWKLFPVRKMGSEKASERLKLLEIQGIATPEDYLEAWMEAQLELERLKIAPLEVGEGEYVFLKEYDYKDGEWVLKATHDKKIKPFKE